MRIMSEKTIGFLKDLAKEFDNPLEKVFFKKSKFVKIPFIEI